MKLLHMSFPLVFSMASQLVFASNQLVLCEDPGACNFGLDEPCVYADLGYDCEGNCIQDVDEDGICDECEPFDLESPDIWEDCFCNFDEYVVEYWTVEEETCTLIFDCDCECINDEDGDGICDEVIGCMDGLACNFDPLAVEDDGSCLYVGDPCDDGDAESTADAISENCECEGTTGVEDLSLARVVLFPNPASDLLIVDIQGRHGSPISLKLKDSAGRVVYAQMAMNQSLLDVSPLSEGLYLLDIEFAGFTVTKQVAIRH